jgi:hypothetical protein
MRVGDAERHDAAEALQKHFAAGRLNWEELDERLGQAYAARTAPELDALFVDLPSSPSVSLDKAGERPPSARRSPPRLAIAIAATWFVAVLAAVALGVADDGPNGHPFAVIGPLILAWWVVGGGAFRHARRHRHANGAPRPRLGNPYAPGGDRHSEVQRLRDHHRSRHEQSD